MKHKYSKDKVGNLVLISVFLLLVIGCNSNRSHKKAPDEVSQLIDSSEVVWQNSLEKEFNADYWANSRNSQTGYSTYSNMKLRDSILVFFWEQQYIGAINSNNGKMLWKQKVPGITILTVHTDSTSAYFVEDVNKDSLRLFVLDIFTGIIKWNRYFDKTSIKDTRKISEQIKRSIGYYQKIDTVGLLTLSKNEVTVCMSENSSNEDQSQPLIYVLDKKKGTLNKSFKGEFVSNKFQFNNSLLKKGSIALNLTTGKSILWSQLTTRKSRFVKENFLSFSYYNNPQFNGKDVVFSLIDSVFSYSVSKGREPWRIKLKESITPFSKGIVLTDKYVIVSSYSAIASRGRGVSSLECFDVTSGELVWSKTIDESEPKDMKLFDGKLYMSYTPFYIIPDPNKKSYILEIDPATGNFLRKFDTDGKIHESIPQIIMQGESIYYFSSLGNIGRINLAKIANPH